MTNTFNPIQLQEFSLAGSGAIAGATTIVLKTFETIDGVPLTITDFGAIGFGTLEPGNGTQEEAISFTGVVQNANGTATLTGVKTQLFESPYTETSGLAKTHPGSSTFVISNTAGFYNEYPSKANDETITGQWTFTNTPIVPGTVSDASTTVKGVSFMSTAPASATGPIAVGSNDSRVPVAYAVDSVGTDAYAITPTPAITAYTAGQIISFKAGTANTGPATLNVSGLGAKTIKKDVSSDLVTGDILANQIVMVEYDGTNFQLLSLESGVKDATQLVGIVPLANLPTRAFAMDFGPSANETLSSTEFTTGSMTDGSAFFVRVQGNGPLYRFERDSLTGWYQQTHSITPTLNIPSTDNGAIINIGIYIYMFTNDGTNIVCSRFLAADLTGEQVMTVPTVACTDFVGAWTDGTFAYVVSNASDTTSRKWSVSGTTFSASSTATVTTNIFERPDSGSMWDGTTAYYFTLQSSANVRIQKLTTIDGSTFTTTTKTFPLLSDTQVGSFMVNIDTTRAYVGIMYAVYNATVQIASRIMFYPVTKP